MLVVLYSCTYMYTVADSVIASVYPFAQPWAGGRNLTPPYFGMYLFTKWTASVHHHRLSNLAFSGGVSHCQLVCVCVCVCVHACACACARGSLFWLCALVLCIVMGYVLQFGEITLKYIIYLLSRWFLDWLFCCFHSFIIIPIVWGYNYNWYVNHSLLAK